MDRLKTVIKSSPFIIALIYVLVGFLWIQYSDQLVFSMFKNSETLTTVQSLKGWFFVTASGILIFFLVKISNDLINDLIEEIKKSRDKFETTFQYAPVGIAHHKPDENWILVNKALCNLLGYKENELLDLNFEDFIHPDDLERGRKLDRELAEGKISSFKTQKTYVRKDGSHFTGQLTKAAVYDTNNEPLYLIAIVEDISDQIESQEKLEKSLKQKEVLLSEVHHRVKNNVALMSALLELQLMHSKNSEVIEILEHYKTRLKTLSLIHEEFSENEKEPTIDFSWYLHKQIGFIQQIFESTEPAIEYQTAIDEIDLNINQAIPVGLICNELLINTNHHNYKGVEKPVIDISLKRTGKSIHFIIKSNGKMEDELYDLRDPDSLDSQIIDALVKQIRGNISFSEKDGYPVCELDFIKLHPRGSHSHAYPGDTR